MFYQIFYSLSEYFSPLNIFQYITFRAGGAMFTSLFLSIFLGPFLINKLKFYKIGQHIRPDLASTHLSKSGTPTMGGL